MTRSLSHGEAAAHLPLQRKAAELRAAASSLGLGHALVVKAEPGSGKSTFLPLLLADSIPSNLCVLVTEPRRLAATGAASYAAELAGCSLGSEVGFAVRGERRFSQNTRVVFATEGLALQLLSDAAFVDRLGCLVVDEFHERHSQTDVLLAVMRSWAMFHETSHGALSRPPPRFVLMSATFNAREWSELFHTQQIIGVEGRSYPVVVEHEAVPPDSHWLVAMRARVNDICAGEQKGHVLCFLPGKREIEDLGRDLTEDLGGRVQVESLHGNRPLSEMQRAFSRQADRKVFLATNIAESSLTIPGVRFVVDSGLERQARFHSVTRTTELSTVKAGKNSSEQRAGRAGREAPGWVTRLFSKDDFLRRETESEPEIAVSSAEAECLTLLRVFQSLGLSTQDWHLGQAVAWLTPPSPERLEACLRTFKAVGAVDDFGEITSRGLRVASFPLSVRLGLVADSSLASPLKPVVLALCLLLEEGLVSSQHLGDREAGEKAMGWGVFRTAYELLRNHLNMSSSGRLVKGSPSSAPIQRVGSAFLKWVPGARGAELSNVLPPFERISFGAVGAFFFRGFFDQVAEWSAGQLRHQSGETFFTELSLEASSGELGRLPGSGSDKRYCLMLSGMRVQSTSHLRRHVRRQQAAMRKRAHLFVPIEMEMLLDGPSFLLSESQEPVETALTSSSTNAIRLGFEDRVCYENLVIDDQKIKVDLPLFRSSLRVWIESRFEEQIVGNSNIQKLLQRLEWAGAEKTRNFLSALRESSGEKQESLVSFVLSSFQQSSQSVLWSPADLCASEQLVHWFLDYDVVQALNLCAPLEFQMTNGRVIRLEYGETEVVARGRIQEFYGLEHHPQVGHFPLTLQLLAPNGQVAQITSNLAQFWKQSYPEVKKAYSGRYPKHHWPDCPQAAPAVLTKRQLRQGSSTKRSRD